MLECYSAILWPKPHIFQEAFRLSSVYGEVRNSYLVSVFIVSGQETAGELYIPLN
jgi:hypothetical protein